MPNGEKNKLRVIEIHLSINLTSYLLAVPVDRNYREDTGLLSCCQWGLEP